MRFPTRIRLVDVVVAGGLTIVVAVGLYYLFTKGPIE